MLTSLGLILGFKKKLGACNWGSCYDNNAYIMILTVLPRVALFIIIDDGIYTCVLVQCTVHARPNYYEEVIPLNCKNNTTTIVKSHKIDSLTCLSKITKKK